MILAVTVAPAHTLHMRQLQQWGGASGSPAPGRSPSAPSPLGPSGSSGCCASLRSFVRQRAGGMLQSHATSQDQSPGLMLLTPAPRLHAGVAVAPAALRDAPAAAISPGRR